MSMDEENELTHFYEIIPEMVWAVRVSPTEVKMYINETDTITFCDEAIESILKALTPFA